MGFPPRANGRSFLALALQLVLIAGSLSSAPAAGDDDPAAPGDDPGRKQLERRARDFIEQSWKLAYAAPDFGEGREWLNVARPMTLRGDLAGRVLLIDFWTYCCINCMHVLPDLKYLEEKYAREPFVVVGCHSAKFLNEADAANVRQAVLRYDIAHPVVVDRDFQIWNAFGVRSWPTLMLVGPDGRILAQLSGEGQRDILDALVGQALAFFREKPDALAQRPLPLRRETSAELARELSFPGKIAIDPAGTSLYIADSNHHRIVVTNLEGRFVRAIGGGEEGLKDGPADEARFSHPQGMAFSGSRLLIADTENHAIRAVDLARGDVTTLAGNGKQGREREGVLDARIASLNSPWDLLVRGEEVLVAMAGPHQIWRLDLEKLQIGPIAGDGTERRADGPFDEGAFAQPSGLAAANGVVYVADSESSSIRALDLARSTITTLVGGDENPRNLFEFGDEDGKGFGKRLQHPLGVLVHEGKLFVADTYNHKIKVVDAAAGEVKTLAGTGRPGNKDGAFAEAELREPGGLAGRGSKLFVADTNNHCVRVLDLEARRVSTLTLSGVPIPRSAAAAPGSDAGVAGGDPLPDLAGTVVHTPAPAKLATGKAKLQLKLSLPPGETLAEGAPSQFRVLPKKGAVRAETPSGRLAGVETAVPIDVEGAGELEVQALYYHCAGGKTCAVRSVRWRLLVEAEAGGASTVTLEDAPGT